MTSWRSIRRLCGLLEGISYELDCKLMKTKKESAKLIDILEAISPMKFMDPRDSVSTSGIANRKKFFKGFDQPAQTQSTEETYAEFVKALEEYKKLPSLPRERLSNSFRSRMLDFSRLTQAHLHERMIPCAKAMLDDLNEVSKLDLDDASQRYKVTYTVRCIEDVFNEYDRLIKANDVFKRVDVIGKEREIKTTTKEVPKKKVDTFETIANLTPKQLNEFYHLRGQARQIKVIVDVKRAISETVLPFLKSYNYDMSPEEKIDFLKLCARSFHLLSNTKRKHALVCHN